MAFLLPFSISAHSVISPTILSGVLVAYQAAAGTPILLKVPLSYSYTTPKYETDTSGLDTIFREVLLDSRTIAIRQMLQSG